MIVKLGGVDVQGSGKAGRLAWHISEDRLLLQSWGLRPPSGDKCIPVKKEL